MYLLRTPMHALIALFFFHQFSVSYGDLYPKTQAGKIFTCCFGLTGIALLGAAVATIGSRLVQAEIDAVQKAKIESRKRLFQMYDSMPMVVRIIRRANSREKKKIMAEAKKRLEIIKLPHFPSGMVVFAKAARNVLQSLAIVAIGGFVVGRFEGWSLANSMYYSLITGTDSKTSKSYFIVHVLLTYFTFSSWQLLRSDSGTLPLRRATVDLRLYLSFPCPLLRQGRSLPV